MLIKIIVSALFLKLILIQGLYSQTRPSLQFTAGFAFPGNDFAGVLVSSDGSGNIFINTDFIKNIARMYQI